MTAPRTRSGLPTWPRLHMVRSATEVRIVLSGPGVRGSDVEAIAADGVLKVVLSGEAGERVVIAVTLPRDADVASGRACRRGDHLTIRLPRVRSPDRSPRRLPVA